MTTIATLRLFNVFCWDRGEDYDAGKPADKVHTFKARNASHAEDKVSNTRYYPRYEVTQAEEA